MSWDSSWVRTSLPWPLVRLKDHVDLTNGFPFDSARFNPSVGTPVIRIRDLLTGTTQTYFEGHVPPEVMVGHGDLLIGMDGDFNAATWTGEPAALNQRLCLIRAGPSIEQRYLGYVIPFPLKAINDVTIWTTVKHLSSLDLLAERIPLPPLAVQRAIADYLDRKTARIDALIEKKQAAIELLDARWLSDLCSRLLFVDTHSPPLYWTRRAMEGWTLIPLKRLLARVWAGDWGAEPGTEKIDLPCVRAADFDFSLLESTSGVDRSFTISSATVRSLLGGDLIIEKSGGGDGVQVGRVVAWRGSEPAMPTNFAGAMRPAPMFDPEFVLLVFRAAYEIGLPWRSIKQTTGLQNLDMGHYLAHRWPVPPIEQQRLAASQLLEALQEIRLTQRKLQKQISLLQEHRQALITAAVAGELEIPGVAA